LIPLGIGMLSAIVVAAAAFEPLLENEPEVMRGLFFGMILVSLVVPYKMAAKSWAAKDYLIAKSRIDNVAVAFEEFFDRYDAILTPAALGTAPKGLASTGNPIMQTVWSFGGLPSVNLPLLCGDNGLPLGVQAVGSFRQDGRLLRSLRWFVQEFDQRSQSE